MSRFSMLVVRVYVLALTTWTQACFAVTLTEQSPKTVLNSSNAVAHFSANNRSLLVSEQAGGTIDVFAPIGPEAKWTQVQRLNIGQFLSNDSNSGWFGVKLYGSHACVGAITNFARMPDSGEVLCLERGDDLNWRFVQRLVSSQLRPYGRFASSLALHGDTLVVGSNSASGQSSSGRIETFSWSGSSWELEETIDNSDPQFGQSQIVAFGNAIATATVSGLYVYRRVAQKWYLEAAPPSLNTAGGIAASGEIIVMGVLEDASKTTRRRGVAVLKGSEGEWRLLNIIWQPIELTLDSDFGSALAIERNTVIVGAPRAGIPPASGRAYVYSIDRDTGSSSLDKVLVSDRPIGDERFGTEVGIDKGKAFVADRPNSSGSPASTPPPRTGSLYLFDLLSQAPSELRDASKLKDTVTERVSTGGLIAGIAPQGPTPWGDILYSWSDDGVSPTFDLQSNSPRIDTTACPPGRRKGGFIRVAGSSNATVDRKSHCASNRCYASKLDGLQIGLLKLNKCDGKPYEFNWSVQSSNGGTNLGSPSISTFWWDGN